MQRVVTSWWYFSNLQAIDWGTPQIHIFSNGKNTYRCLSRGVTYQYAMLFTLFRRATKEELIIEDKWWRWWYQEWWQRRQRQVYMCIHRLCVHLPNLCTNGYNLNNQHELQNVLYYSCVWYMHLTTIWQAIFCWKHV